MARNDLSGDLIMAVFEAREIELLTILDGPAGGLDTGVKNALKAKVGEVKRINVELYEQLIKFVTTYDKSIQKATFDSAWLGAVNTAKSKLNGVFTSEPTARSLPESFRGYWLEVYVQENRSLDSISLDAWRGHFFQMVRFEYQMATMVNEMFGKWKKTLEDKERFVSPEKQAIDLMTDAVKRSIENATSLKQSVAASIESTKALVKLEQKGLASKIAESLIKDYKTTGIKIIVAAAVAFFGGLAAGITAGLIAVAQGEVSKQISRMSENLELFRTGIEQYRSLMINTGFVLGMFKTNRDMVQKYRSEQSVSKIEVARDLAEQELAKRAALFASPQFTMGMAKDATTFATRLSAQVAGIHKRCVDVENLFVGQFRGVFEASLSDVTIEALTDARMFDRYLADTLLRVDARASGREVLRLKGEVEAEFGVIMDAASHFEGMPEEARLVWLEQSKAFRRDMQRAFDDTIKAYLEQFVQSKGQLEAITLKVPGEAGREMLTALIS